MTTILIGWELGAGLGHIGMLLPVAEGLRRRGAEPVLALRDLSGTAALLAGRGLTVLQGPVSPVRTYPKGYTATSYADILASAGFDDTTSLTALVRAWQGLLDMVRPAAVLCESAPVLALTARGRCPVVVMGDGFSVPPHGPETFPALRPGGEPVMAQDALLAIVRDVMGHTGGMRPETLPAAIAGDRRFVCTVPELDPYAAVRDDPHAGPLTAGVGVDPAPFPDVPAYFAYLGGDLPYVPRMLQGLNRCGVAGSVYVHKPPPAMARDLPRSRFTAHAAPQPLGTVLPAATLAVHHASTGISLAALAAGRPQIVVPRHLQNALTADRLVRAGVAARLPRDLTPDRMARAVATMAEDTAMQDRARALGRDIAGRDYGDVAGRIADACLTLAA